MGWERGREGGRKGRVKGEVKGIKEAENGVGGRDEGRGE